MAKANSRPSNEPSTGPNDTEERKDDFKARLLGELRNKICRLILSLPSVIHIHVCGTGQQYLERVLVVHLWTD